MSWIGVVGWCDGASKNPKIKHFYRTHNKTTRTTTKRKKASTHTHPVDGGEGAGVVPEDEVGGHELRGAGRLHPHPPRLLLVVHHGVERRLMYVWV